MSMYKSVLLFACLCFCASTTWSQSFAGPNTARLSAEGSASTTTFETNAMVGRYVAETQQLTFMAKTAAIPLSAVQDDQDLYDAVFMPDANPLFRISIDLSDVNLPKEQTSYTLPAQISWNDQNVQQTVTLVLQEGEKGLVFDLSTTLTLQAFNLKIPAEYADRFSNQISLSMTDAVLTPR